MLYGFIPPIYRFQPPYLPQIIFHKTVFLPLRLLEKISDATGNMSGVSSNLSNCSNMCMGPSDATYQTYNFIVTG